MSSKVYSAAVVGVEAFEVEIEVHVGWGNTDKIAVVGLPDTSVKESKDRSPPPFVPAFCAGRTETDYDQSGPADVRKDLEAKRRCGQTLIVPLENAAEAAVVEGVDVYGACSLSQVVHFLRGDIALDPVHSINGWPDAGSAEPDLDLGEAKGQQYAKRAVEVVADDGGHNILTIGPIPSGTSASFVCSVEPQDREILKGLPAG
jgi:magnesium chelatase family protein